jgi:methionyl-tRNA formyltransferase
MKKIGVIGSRDLSCKILEWIVREGQVEVVGVVAPPFKGWWNDNLRQTAHNLNIDVIEDLDLLVQRKPEIIFSINYWKIIEEEIIEKIPEGIVNIHHSYLLKYRGRYSTSWAIMNARRLNVWIHGTTLHYIKKELDAGPIIASSHCDITESDTAESLFLKVENLALEMFKGNFLKILDCQIKSFLNPDPEFFYYDINSNKNIDTNFEGIQIAENDFLRAWTFKNRQIPSFSEKNDERLKIKL